MNRFKPLHVLLSVVVAVALGGLSATASTAASGHQPVWRVAKVFAQVSHSLRAMNTGPSCLRWMCTEVASEADTFGELLRTVRLSQGLSQGALASRLGVSQPVVSKWESGRCAPVPATVERLAHALGVTLTMSVAQATS